MALASVGAMERMSISPRLRPLATPFPIIMKLNFGMTPEYTAIWFGIMVLMTVGFGMLAPPVGLNVYVVNGMAKDVPLSESYKGITPFLISDTVRTLLLLFFPGISLFLVQYLT